MESNNKTWGWHLNSARDTLKPEVFAAYVEVVGCIHELSFIYIYLSNPSISVQLNEYIYWWLKNRQPENLSENEKEDYWVRHFEAAIALLVSQIRMYTKSVGTLRNKLYILVDLAESLEVAQYALNNKLFEKDFKTIHTKASDEGKSIVQVLKSDKSLLRFTKNRNDTEHNIDALYQEQMSIIFVDCYYEKDKLALKHIVPDYESLISSFKIIQTTLMPQLNSYLGL